MGWIDRLAIDEGAILAIQVFQPPDRSIPSELEMMPGYKLVSQDNIIIFVCSEAGCCFQAKGCSSWRIGIAAWLDHFEPTICNSFFPGRLPQAGSGAYRRGDDRSKDPFE